MQSKDDIKITINSLSNRKEPMSSIRWAKRKGAAMGWRKEGEVFSFQKMGWLLNREIT